MEGIVPKQIAVCWDCERLTWRLLSPPRGTGDKCQQEVSKVSDDRSKSLSLGLRDWSALLCLTVVHRWTKASGRIYTIQEVPSDVATYPNYKPLRRYFLDPFALHTKLKPTRPPAESCARSNATMVHPKPDRH